MTYPQISRRGFLGVSAAGIAASIVSTGFAQNNPPELQWFDVQDWGLEGKGWTDTKSFFDRLPARAEGKVPAPVWNLSRHSAGLMVNFRTNAPAIWVDHVVTKGPPHTQDNMSPIGVSGVDLYATNPKGEWKWLAVSRPKLKETKAALISDLAPGERDYRLYLPLYNGTESLKIGVPAGYSFTKVAPRTDKPIVFYGTSITHGASASRPGMPHPAILGRRLDKPVINLGFSGNGRMEKEVGDFLIELDPCLYVIDCLPNMTGDIVAERAAPLVRQIRAARPETPIVLVEDRTYANAEFLPKTQARQAASRKAFQEAYKTLQSEGVKKLWYIEGEKLLGEDREDTIDSSHPNDLGFWRQANAMEPVLREALGMK